MPEVIVASHSSYRDTWDPFCALFGRFWPDCPWPVSLVTNLVDGVDGFDPFERGIGVPGVKDWSARLLIALADRDARDVILLLQDDFFLSGAADTTAIRAGAELLAQDPDTGLLRLNPCPGPLDGREIGRIGPWPIGEVHRGEPYRISCQASLWRVGYLKRALFCGGNPSDFEQLAGAACGAWPERVLSVLRSHVPGPLPYYCTAIVSGHWQEDALELCRREGVPVTSTRPIDRRRSR